MATRPPDDANPGEGEPRGLVVWKPPLWIHLQRTLSHALVRTSLNLHQEYKVKRSLTQSMFIKLFTAATGLSLVWGLFFFFPLAHHYQTERRLGLQQLWDKTSSKNSRSSVLPSSLQRPHVAVPTRAENHTKHTGRIQV